MDAVVNAALEAIRTLPPLAVYALVLLAAFGSTAFALDVILPGETGVLVGGWTAAQGEPEVMWVIAAAAVGAWAGDTFSYAIGRRGGQPLIRRWEPVRKRLEPEVERAEAFYERRGGLAIFLGRWVGTLRAVMAFVAGVAEMRFARFVAWNLVASVAWATAITLIGFHFGQTIVDAFRQATLPIALSVTGLVILFFVLRWIERHPDRAPRGLPDRLPPAGWSVAIAGLLAAWAVATVVVAG